MSFKTGSKSINFLITLNCILVLALIALGGAVRAMDAGLACPDWPLCFGKFVPDFHPQVYFEFIHRALAGLVFLFTLALSFLIFKNKDLPPLARQIISACMIILIVQIVMGGLTVLKLLHFGVVTGHLALGVLFFLLLITLQFQISNDFPKLDNDTPLWPKLFSATVVITVFGQILLGGLVSSNYAGLACPDFPLCHGAWMPTLEGDVGLQVIHRFGAYLTFSVVYLFYLLLRFKHEAHWMSSKIFFESRMCLSLVMLQVAVGMANVLLKLPPVVTVLHLVVAAMVIMFSLRTALYISYDISTD